MYEYLIQRNIRVVKDNSSVGLDTKICKQFQTLKESSRTW